MLEEKDNEMRQVQGGMHVDAVCDAWGCYVPARHRANAMGPLGVCPH